MLFGFNSALNLFCVFYLIVNYWVKVLTYIICVSATYIELVQITD